MLYLQRKDVAISGISMTPSREAVIDYTTAHYRDPTSLVFKISTKSGLYFVLPFTLTLWIAVLGLPIIGYILHVISGLFTRRKEKASFRDALHIWKAVVSQGIVIIKMII